MYLSIFFFNQSLGESKYPSNIGEHMSKHCHILYLKFYQSYPSVKLSSIN